MNDVRPRERVLALAQAGGIVRSRDITAAGIARTYLQRLCQEGRLVRVARGLYQAADADITAHHSLVEASRALPHGVICLLSALQFYGLTTQAPYQVWITVGAKKWVPKQPAVSLRVIRAHDTVLTAGVEHHTIEGVAVPIYGAAKTVADCFKHRNKLGIDVAVEALRDCLKRSHGPQGIYTLTVPTGGGKTLASLRYALHHAAYYKLERIIYVIPYTSIIEQNAGVVREMIEAEGDPFPWVLEHHSSLEPSSQTWHAKLVAENWDAPIVFTTMVQFLETLFAGGTRSVRRMHQLANAVLIFDEIQTLPIKCVHMFCNALNFLTRNTKTTAVLCTATQPLLDKLPLSENGELRLASNPELVTNKYESAERLRRVDVRNRTKPGGWSEEEVAEGGAGPLRWIPPR